LANSDSICRGSNPAAPASQSLRDKLKLKVIPGWAHVPQLQAPKLFLEVIGDFLPATNSAAA
jgi:3-oxoadipate enol-lactonase